MISLKHIAIVITALAVVAGCLPTDPEIETIDFFEGIPIVSRENVDVTIMSDQVTCYGAFAAQKCLVILFEDGERETLTEGIAGYQHIDGNERQLVPERITFDTSKPELLPQDIGAVQYRLLTEAVN